MMVLILEEENPKYLNDFLDYMLTIQNKSKNTVKEYNYDLATFLRFIKMHFNLTDEKDLKKIFYADVSIDILKRITLEDLHSFLGYLTKNYNSKPRTRSRKTSSLKAFFKYLYQKKLIEINPAQDLETPKLDKTVPKYLTLEESKKLLNAASIKDNNRNDIRNYAITTLFLNCGIRLSELVGININDIKFDECRMNITGKGQKQRTIALNNACMNAINNYLKVRPKERLSADSKKALFLSERRQRISRRMVQDIIYTELKKAGLNGENYSVHKLRHTAATLMYQYGQVDIRALKELLGHESISTTEIYTHISSDQVRNAVESNPLSEEKMT